MADPALDFSAPASPRDASGDRILAAINYGLMLVSLANGLTLIIAVVLAYVRRDQAEPWLKSHFTFQIATFWYSIAIFLLGFATIWLLGLGLLIWLAGALWLIVRAAVGLVRIVDRQPCQDPWGLLV